MEEFDLDIEEAREYNAAYKQDSRSFDRRICICGHAMSRHHFNDYTGGYYCKPGQLSCACINKRPVIEVPNTRYFMRKSHGSGPKHALVLGMIAATEAMGDDFTSQKNWLVEELCDICGQESKFYPVRVTPEGDTLPDQDEDQGVTAFKCVNCRT